MFNRKKLTLFITVAFIYCCAFAQQTAVKPCIKVSGEVTHPLQLCAEELQKMKHITVSSKDRGGAEHQYSGVPIADIFKLAGVSMGRELRGENLAKYLLVTSADNYQVVFSLAELDSAFTDRVVILADAMDGKPLEAGVGPYRMIVPGEKRPARNSFQVVALTVLFAKEKE
ncbi:MAG: molybdopterin-dependent oxidoreductase [Chitinophagaceae bacterium]